MSQYTGAKSRKKNISEERRLEIIETHIRQAIRHDRMLCSMFGIHETELTALLKRSSKMVREYLYILEEQKQALVDHQQATL